MNTAIRKKAPILASLAVLLIMGATLLAFVIPASAWTGTCSNDTHTTVLGTATVTANGQYTVRQGDPFTVDGSSHWCWGLFVSVPTPTTTVTDTKTKTATTTVTIPPTTVTQTDTATQTVIPPSHVGTFQMVVVLPTAYSSSLPPMSATVAETQTTANGQVTKTLWETSPIVQFSQDGGRTVYAAFYVTDSNVLPGTTSVTVTFTGGSLTVPFPTTPTPPAGGIYTSNSPNYGYYWETLT